MNTQFNKGFVMFRVKHALKEKNTTADDFSLIRENSILGFQQYFSHWDPPPWIKKKS